MNADGIKRLFKSKTVKIIFLCVVALLLLLAVWKVFFNEKSAQSDGYAATEEETRLASLLTKIDGVSEATVMITKEEREVVGAVVVFRGEDGILTRLRIIEIASGALNIKEASVIVYAAQ